MDQWNKNLIFWKDKQNWQATGWINQEKIKEDSNKHKQKLVRGHYNWYNRNKWIIRSPCEHLCVCKLENLEETDKFLETYNPPRLNQEEIGILNRPIMSNEIESIIKKILQQPPKNLRTRWIYNQFLPDLQRRTGTNLTETIPKNWGEGSPS